MPPVGNPAAEPGENTYTVHRGLMPTRSVLHFVILEVTGTDGIVSRTAVTSLVDGDHLPCKLYPPDVTAPK